MIGIVTLHPWTGILIINEGYYFATSQHKWMEDYDPESNIPILLLEEL